MTNRVGYRVEGLNEVVRDLQAAGVEIDELKDAFAAIADRGAKLAAGFAPQRTGRLAGSIRGNRAKGKAVVTAGRSVVPYAGPINYGWPTRNIRPAEFMQRADAELQPYAVQQLEDEINEVLRKRGLT
jgi:phage gpG-like protein